MGSGSPPLAHMGVYELQRCAGDAKGEKVVDPVDSGHVLAGLGCEVSTGDVECDAADAKLDRIVDPLDSGYVMARFSCSMEPEDPECEAADVNIDGGSTRSTLVLCFHDSEHAMDENRTTL